jgi:hypothetical protein
MTKKINDLEVLNSEIVEENEEMRRRLGIKAGDKLDLSNIRTIKTIELVCFLKPTSKLSRS